MGSFGEWTLTDAPYRTLAPMRPGTAALQWDTTKREGFAVRIAVISDCYPPHMGGIEAQVEGLALRLGQAGYRVEVVTASPGPAGAVPLEGADSGRLSVTRAALPLPGFVPVNPFAGPALKTALRHCDVAHIHVGVVSPLALHALALASKRHVPTVVTFHCMLDGWQTFFKATGLYRTTRPNLQLTAVSSTLAAQVAKVAGREVSVIPNGVALSRWRHIARCRPTPPRPHEPIRLVSALRFMPRKRPLALVTIMRRVRTILGADCPQLSLFGEGVQLGAVRAAVAAAGLSDVVTCPGRLSEADLQMAYLAADAFVLASVHESFGIAALEARAAGLPVIARAGTGIADFITDGVDGVFASSDRGLANVLVDLVRNPGKLVDLQAGAAREALMSWHDSLAAAEAAYRQVTSRG